MQPTVAVFGTLRFPPERSSGDTLLISHELSKVSPENPRYGISREIVAGHELLKVSDGELEMVIGEKAAPTPVPAAWQRRAGTYKIVNAGDDVTLVSDISLRMDDGLLLVEYSLPDFGEARISSIIRPNSDDEAVFFGLWRGMGETIRVVREQGVEQIVFSGYRLVPVNSGE